MKWMQWMSVTSMRAEGVLKGIKNGMQHGLGTQQCTSTGCEVVELTSSQVTADFDHGTRTACHHAR